MKKNTFFYIVFIALFGFTNPSQAQSDFAPLGAVWYNNFYNGVYKNEVVSDTSILGVICSKITQSVFIKSSPWFGWEERNARDIYLHSTPDTVFIYNDLYKNFTPLYVFNVKAGDTVRLQDINPANSCVKIDTAKTQFAFIVDSVKDVIYDGVSLKTVYSTAIDTGEAYLAWNQGMEKSNVYVQKLGALKYGLLPDCNKMCPTILEGCNRSLNLRCYTDSKISVKLSDTCMPAGLVPASISEIEKIENSLFIYPNPATDMVSIVNASLQSPSNLLVLNALGQIVLQKEYKAGNKITFDAGSFARGVYFVRLENKTKGSITTGKLIKE
ncbi:MAG: T9SS type A sorting domain-containing protein [Chitinophagaceae bacterium]|jgi:hypothetical protein